MLKMEMLSPVILCPDCSVGCLINVASSHKLIREPGVKMSRAGHNDTRHGRDRLTKQTFVVVNL